MQAHATQRSVSLFYVAPSMRAAAYVADWDEWRDAGLLVTPCYLPEVAQVAQLRSTGKGSTCEEAQLAIRVRPGDCRQHGMYDGS